MGSSVFVLKYAGNEKQFAESFLTSADFDMEGLREIARRMGLGSTGRSKAETASLISLRAGNYTNPRHLQIIIEQLFARAKDAISIKTGTVRRFTTAADPGELVTSDGREVWYGPVTCPGDADDVAWYVRPKFVEYWDVTEADSTPRRFQARWLCFARVTTEAISLHWRGFTYPGSPDAVQNTQRNAQFAYWLYVPEFFDELEELLHARVEYVNLHNLMIHYLWDRYLEDSNYTWKHIRIRAESSGVSLNAHAGASDNELNVGGILHLARTVRIAVETELRERNQYTIPNPTHMDNTILRTLIQKYGALSYGFRLATQNRLLFKAHSYFGLKPDSRLPDSFPHMQVTASDREVAVDADALSQLQFVLEHAREMVSSGSLEPQPLQMF